MEEDIKILEELAKEVIHLSPIEIPYRKKQAQAIENLLTRYKEMREEIDGLKLDRRNLLGAIEAIKQTTPINMVTDTDYSINIEINSIPKSKVKEKMKKYQWSLNGYDSSTADYKHSQCIGRYLALQELLREE